VFERRGPTRYVLRVDGEELTVHVPDDDGFGRALRYMRNERVPLIPRWLGVAAATIIAGALGMAALGATEEPAAADITPSAASPVTTTAALATTVATAPAPSAETTLADRWNALVPLGSGLELSGVGATQISRHLTVTVTDQSVRVQGTPSESDLDNQRIMAAMGIAIGASNPGLEPVARKNLLKALGLDVAGANHIPLDGSLTSAGLELHLVFEPGTMVDLLVSTR
jgi:hypothetical protein